MLTIFQKNRPLQDLLFGYQDVHCHILPGVDDGVRTVEEALRILKRYELAGVKGVCFTPHVMEDVPNTPEILRSAFDTLKQAYSGPLTLSLASENMMDELFERRLADNLFLPIGGIRLLVETSYYNPPYNMQELLSGVFSAGYFPILAHPERYTYMSFKDYESLKARGIAFQMNISSLVGYYGDTARKKAEKMLSAGMYNYVGTDLHRESLLDCIGEGRIKEKIYDIVEELITNNLELA